MQSLQYQGPARKVLVAGATGFVGQHLQHHLINRGLEVVAVSRTPLSGASKDPRLTWMPMSEVRSSAVRIPGLAAVVNCAVCYGRNGEGLAEMSEVNAVLPLQLLDLCRSNDCPRFIHLDTFSWKPRTGAFVRSPYSITKRMAWDLLEGAAARDCLVTVARLEFPYGPNDRPHKFVSRLLAALHSEVPTFEMSDGRQLRDFVWIGDVCDSVSALATAAAAPGFLELELGTGVPTSLREFATTLRDCMGSSTELHFGAIPRIPGEMECSFADVENLAKLAPVPATTVAEGCRYLAAAWRQCNRTKGQGTAS